MRASVNSKISLSWHMCGPYQALVAYQGDNQIIVSSLVDYCLYLSRNCALNARTVSNNILYIKRFLEFLNGKTNIHDVTDAVLEKFRDEELARVCRQPNNSGREMAAKRTVNAKLRKVYRFLHWYQDIERRTRYLIGPRGCKVRSTVGQPSHHTRQMERDLFPLTFRMVGEGSRHRVKYVAAPKDIDDLTQRFLEGRELSGQRNILIMELACRVGMRRGSINSLRVDQFIRDEIDKKTGDWGVVPLAQKFGYENRFEIPFRLAYRVCDYIDLVVRPMMKERGWTNAVTEGRIFFSFKSGRPLRDQTLSQIFGKALDDLGVSEHGANMHGFRRKYANDEIIRELDRRLAQGLDTSVASVAASVSITLGHSNPQSIEPYVSGARSRKQRQAELDSSQAKLEELEDVNRELRDEVMYLRGRLRKSRT